MVQYVTTRRANWYQDAIANPRDFWKIQLRNDMKVTELRDFLRAQHIPVGQRALKPTLLAQHIRWQRGLPDYEKCSLPELRTLASNRGLFNMPGIRKPQRKAGFVARLEEADDGETFTRFLDLPAELRLRIYEFHFHSFETDVKALPAPFPIPITEVSSQLRSESLPLYYSICTFDFDVNQIRRPHFTGQHYYMNGENRFSSTSMQKFIHKGPAERIAMLRKVKIQGEMVNAQRPYNLALEVIPDDLWINTTVDFGSDHKDANVGPHKEHTKNSGGAKSARLREQTMALLRKVISGMNQRQGGKKLLASDISAICNIFNDGRVRVAHKDWISERLIETLRDRADAEKSSQAAIKDGSEIDSDEENDDDSESEKDSLRINDDLLW